MSSVTLNVVWPACRAVHRDVAAVTSKWLLGAAGDLGVVILQAINSNRVVSPLDYDIFVNKLHELDVVSTDFIENIIEKYTHTQSAIEVVDSSAHAIVRAYLDFQKYDNLLSLAKRRASTGVFLDPVAANMFANHLVKSEDWSSVIDVMWELCLQNYFYEKVVSPLPLAFTLLAGVKFVRDLPQEQTLTVENDDSEEVEYVFVPYVRNPHYDNFFDIERVRLKLGVLWLQIRDVITNRPNSLTGTPGIQHQTLEAMRSHLTTGLLLFGLSLTEQMDALKAELSQISSAEQLEKKQLSTNVLETLLHITESALTREDTETIERGRPVQPRKSDVASAVAQIQQLIELSKPLSEDFLTKCDRFAREGILTNEACVAHETMLVRDLYTRFANERATRWSEREETNRKQDILRHARQTLRQLIDEEERLNYFRDYEEISLKAWLAPRTRKEQRWSKMKDWRADMARQKEKQQRDRDAQM
ncbi:unnamed protein product [Echinostoma caproni]|uniref:Uncharacterized protein n=1 Tax=Echinostoma caproni TaxID=27848 RepID=A0A3P8L1Z5_9TREM|nr:unnamed protein product [Echinostoma caproni]